MIEDDQAELEKLSDSENVSVKDLTANGDFIIPKEEFPNSTGRKRCPYGCHKLLAQRTIEYHRGNGCRIFKQEPIGDTDRRKIYCCGVCYEEFVMRSTFFEHLSTEHEVHAHVHRITFPSKAIFDRYVHWLEKEGGAHFRHKSGTKARPSGKGIFMACNRSGTTNRLPGRPTRSKIGPFRTGYSCTAFIHGTVFPDGTVSVEACGDHYGHDARMRLPMIIKQLIAQKQMDGEAGPDIVRYLKRQFGPLSDTNIFAKRVCIVDCEELRTLLVSSTRKWETNGIPTKCEIWEEELLDAAGIMREGVERLRPLEEKTSDQLAEQYRWPHPHVFTTRLKTPLGQMDFPELKPVTAELRRDLAALAKQQEEEESLAEDIIDVETLEPRIHAEDDLLLEESNPCNNGNLRAVKSAKPTKGLMTRSAMLKKMCNDLAALEKLICHDSGKVKAPCLVAFQTRIRSLRSAYAATISAAKEASAGDAASFSNESEVEAKRLKISQEEEDLSKDTTSIEEHIASALPGSRFQKEFWS